jgi:hypothetical protein
MFSASVHAKDNNHQRSLWYIGFGIGTGNGTLNYDDDSTVNMKKWSGGNPSVLEFGIGFRVTQKILFGAELIVCNSEKKSGHGTYVSGVSYAALVMTFYPTDSGFFIRNGIGISEYSNDMPPSVLARGDSVIFGTGYAFWVGKSFNLILNFDFSYHRFYTSKVHSGTLYSMYLSCYWF